MTFDHMYINAEIGIWSNFMRMHIDKKLCHFFMVNLSSLLTLIFIEIAWGFFLLLRFKLLVDDSIKNDDTVVVGPQV